MNLLTYPNSSCVEPIFRRGLPIQRIGPCPSFRGLPHRPRSLMALRGQHGHHYSSNNPPRRPSSGWRWLLRTATVVAARIPTLLNQRIITSIQRPRSNSPYNRHGLAMDWNRVEGNWKQLKGQVKEKWGKLTD